MNTTLPIAYTVKDVIDALQKCPQDAPVLIESLNGNGCLINTVKVINDVPFVEKYATKEKPTLDIVLFELRKYKKP